MKKEVAFFKDKRGQLSAANLIKLYRELGYTDAQIIEEMKKLKAAKQTAQAQQPPASGKEGEG